MSCGDARTPAAEGPGTCAGLPNARPAGLAHRRLLSVARVPGCYVKFRMVISLY